MKPFLQKFKDSKKITLMLVIINILLLNWISYGAYVRFDLSRTGRLRLTSATKNILRKLPDQVRIEVFFSSKVPDSLIQPVKQLRDFLSEYESIANGKVSLIFNDPTNNKEAEQRAKSLGIRKSQSQIQSKNKFSVEQIYLGVAVLYGDEKFVINDVIRSSQLEYELTSRIYKMAYPSTRKVGMLTSNTAFKLTEDRQDPFHTYNVLNKQLETFYGNIVEVKTNNVIPANISTLLIPTPFSMSDLDKFRVDQFILSGGKVILLVSGMNVDFRRGVMPVDNKILTFFKHYGINIGADMVLDVNVLPYRQSVFARPIPYPAWVMIKKDNLNEKSIITQDLSSLFVAYGSSVKPDYSKLKGIDGKQKANVTILAKTTPNGYTKNRIATISPEAMYNEARNAKVGNRGQYNVAMMVKAKYKSFFTQKDMKLPKEADKNYLKESIKEAQILAFPSPLSISDYAMSLSQGSNLHFILSALDTMHGLDELVKARNKEISNPVITDLSYGKKTAIILINFLLPLLVIVIVGILKRMKRKRNSQLTFDGFENADVSDAKEESNKEVA